MIDFISDFLEFPPQFDFILYLLAAALFLALFLITVDFFASLFFGIFRRR